MLAISVLLLFVGSFAVEGSTDKIIVTVFNATGHGNSSDSYCNADFPKKTFILDADQCLNMGNTTYNSWAFECSAHYSLCANVESFFGPDCSDNAPYHQKATVPCNSCYQSGFLACDVESKMLMFDTCTSDTCQQCTPMLSGHIGQCKNYNMTNNNETQLVSVRANNFQTEGCSTVRTIWYNTGSCTNQIANWTHAGGCDAFSGSNVGDYGMVTNCMRNGAGLSSSLLKEISKPTQADLHIISEILQGAQKKANRMLL